MFVSVPYEITLLSNWKMNNEYIFPVSVPYEITLLSNNIDYYSEKLKVKYHMKIQKTKNKN